ncbi:hypothetical protein [Nitrincola nitratireducens]|uniref:Argininosuccinate lyase n=1 Tax=Nitrincola nitratireducens TaxID=1229521 RepID=W9V0D9_9GAMM|nr:hypothetical protein [Nitrincola nitratireducens]EXJ12948.1 hypothetical protein D791_00290 [Nitrincola nitratireducens]
MRTKLLLPLILSCLLALPALAADYYVDITNKTGYQINQLYVSPGDQKSWEEDVLGNDVLVNGTTQRVTLTGYSSPVFDIRLIDSDGDSYTFWDINVEEYDLLVTPDDLD